MTLKLPIQLTVIPLDEKNRMLRFGIGLHDGHGFARVDLWWIGVRATKGITTWTF